MTGYPPGATADVTWRDPQGATHVEDLAWIDGAWTDPEGCHLGPAAVVLNVDLHTEER